MKIRLDHRELDLFTGRMSDGTELRPLELRVVQVLAGAAPEPVSARTLLVEALGYHPDSRSRTLYSTIRRLRVAVERDPDHPRLVQSVRGVGYQLAVGPTPGARPALPPEPAESFGPDPADVGRPPVVTRIGPPGVGKSHQALREAHRRARAGAAVTWIGDGEGVRGLADRLGRPPIVDAVAAALRPGVVVLDDVADGVESVRLLADALPPGVELWVTTDRPLDVPGERVVHVEPLALPDATAMLAARARAHHAAFDPAPVLAELERLAARLDGLPLALELAAIRLGTLSPATLLQDTALALPARRAGPERHSSLEALVDATWDRLDAEERTWVSRLSVLEGSFGVPVAEAALGRVERWDAGGVLTHLHRVGLLASHRSPRRPFRQLGALLPFVRRRSDPAEREAAADRVARYTEARAHAHVVPPLFPRPRFDGGQDADAVEESLRRAIGLGADRAVLGYALVHLVAGDGRTAAACHEAELALAAPGSPTVHGLVRLTRAMARWMAGRNDEALHELAAMSDDPAVPTEVRELAMLAWVRRSVIGGDPVAGERLDALCRAEGPIAAEAWELAGLSAIQQGRPALALARLEQAERRLVGSPRAYTVTTYRADALTDARRPVEALAVLDGVVNRLAAAVGRGDDGPGVPLALAALHQLKACTHVDARRAVADAPQVVAWCERYGSPDMAFGALRHQAEAWVFTGRLAEAAHTMHALAAIPRRTRTQHHQLAVTRALLALASDRAVEAEAEARAALDLADPFELPDAVERLVEALVLLGRDAEAAEEFDRAVAAAPSELVWPGRTWLLRAELDGDRTAAAARIGASPREPADRCLQAVAAGDPACARRWFERAADPDGTIAGWLAVAEGRPGAAPPYRVALRRALAR